MKKNTLSGHFCLKVPRFKQFFRIMRITVFLLMFCVFSSYAENSHSQNAKVSIRMNDTELSNVLTEIESQTSYLFIYNNKVDAHHTVSVKANQTPVSQVLDQILKNTDLTYKYEGTHIILSKKSEEKQAIQATQQQQKKTVSGVVLDAAGESIIGANVTVKGTDTGTITDIDGNFKIQTDPNATIVVTFIGYLKKEINVKNQSTVRVVLDEDANTLDEVVVVGFGTQKKVNLTGSVSVISSKEIASRPVSNVGQALQGLVPGMNFSYDSNGAGGELGAEMKMNIRGAGTIGSGSKSSPLVLIDGMEGDMNMLNPQDIDNISILKDAAASSIYGSRAPFGVILITTKKGKAGKVSVNYNNSFRWTQAINMPDVVDSYTYAKFFNKMLENSGEGAYFSDERLAAIKDYQDGKITTTTKPDVNSPTMWDWIGNTNTDWYDTCFGETAFSQEHAIAVNGGAEKIQYYFSSNFLGEEGLMAIRSEKSKRYTVTANINAQPFNWLNFSYNIKYMRKDFTKPSALGDQTYYHNIAKRWPMEPTVDPNGHPMALLNDILYRGDANTQTDWLYQQFKFVAEPIKDWKIFAELNYKTVDSFAHGDWFKEKRWDVANELIPDDKANSASEQTERTNYFNTNVYSEYSKSLNGHNLKAMVGFQAELNKWRKLKATKNDLITETIPQYQCCHRTIKY